MISAAEALTPVEPLTEVPGHERVPHAGDSNREEAAMRPHLQRRPILVGWSLACLMAAIGAEVAARAV